MAEAPDIPNHSKFYKILQIQTVWLPAIYVSILFHNYIV